MQCLMQGLVFATITAARTAGNRLLKNAADTSGNVMFSVSEVPGMVLVLDRGGQTLISGYGETATGNHQTPDEHSLLCLNSITKLFTTEVLVSLAAKGKLALSDPLQRFAGRAKVPRFGTRSITLLDLATHSAALPRDLPEGAVSGTSPTRKDRWRWLAGHTLPWAPGTIAAYSNVGFDLLADAIESAGKKPYRDLLRTHVTAPLGMNDTCFAPSRKQCAQLMTGSGDDDAAPCGDMHADGSDGLYSTAGDMALWLRHNVREANDVLALSHAVYRPRQSMPAAVGFGEASPIAGLGLGWVSVAAQGIEPMLLVKSGGGPGFMSYIAFAPGRNAGMFVAVNRLDYSTFPALTDGANKLLASLVTR
jgi:serine-type D-Ala-D-Ala carboxypeptidase/endopeptidase